MDHGAAAGLRPRMSGASARCTRCSRSRLVSAGPVAGVRLKPDPCHVPIRTSVVAKSGSAPRRTSPGGPEPFGGGGGCTPCADRRSPPAATCTLNPPPGWAGGHGQACQRPFVSCRPTGTRVHARTRWGPATPRRAGRPAAWGETRGRGPRPGRAGPPPAPSPRGRRCSARSAERRLPPRRRPTAGGRSLTGTGQAIGSGRRRHGAAHGHRWKEPHEGALGDEPSPDGRFPREGAGRHREAGAHVQAGGAAGWARPPPRP